MDSKVLVERRDAQRLFDAISRGYFPLQRDPLQALARNGFLLVLDENGTRIDLLLADSSFDAAAIRRAKALEMKRGVVARVCTAEDLIIYKLVTLRPRDRDDAASVIKRLGEKLDDQYIVKWLAEFEQALGDSTLVMEDQGIRRARKKTGLKRK